MYQLALVCPPLAILLCGKPFQAFFSIAALCCFWVPGAFWATLVVADRKSNARMKRYGNMSQGGLLIRTVLHEMTSKDPSHETFVDKDNADEAAELMKALARIGLVVGLFRLTVVVILNLPRLAFLALLDGIEAVRLAVPAALRAYRELPEWAQPVVWGLAAGTPVSIIAAIFFAVRMN